MSDKLVPFGKYKGESLSKLTSDKEYSEWLIAQPWFRQEFSAVYKEILRASRPVAATPVHNKMQTLFLDSAFVAVFLDNVLENTWEPIEYEARFEESGWDVVLFFNWRRVVPRTMGAVYVECKPTMGDDYPAVLRQIKARQNLHIAPDRSSILRYHRRILLLGEYTGVGAEAYQMEQIFAHDSIRACYLETFIAAMSPGS